VPTVSATVAAAVSLEPATAAVVIVSAVAAVSSAAAAAVSSTAATVSAATATAEQIVQNITNKSVTSHLLETFHGERFTAIGELAVMWR